MSKEQLLQEIINNMTAMRRLMLTCMQSSEATRLPISQAELLFWVQHQGATNLKTLAKTMQLTPGAITQLVESLEKSGLVTRTPSTSDRRVILVDVTPQGKTTLSALHAQKVAMFQQAYSTLELEELKLMAKVQKKIIANMEAIANTPKEKE